MFLQQGFHFLKKYLHFCWFIRFARSTFWS